MKVLIISPEYPSQENKHAYAFVHARAKIYLANGFNIQVFVPSRTSLHNYCYEGVSIYKACALQGGGTKNPSLSSVYVGRITGKELAYRNTDGLVKLFNTGDLGSLFIMGERAFFISSHTFNWILSAYGND
jgi:hypothetical protein